MPAGEQRLSGDHVKASERSGGLWRRTGGRTTRRRVPTFPIDQSAVNVKCHTFEVGQSLRVFCADFHLVGMSLSSPSCTNSCWRRGKRRE